eukprot:4590103-Pyramimonas_sp.AAC.1
MSSDAAAGRERERCLDADSLFKALAPFVTEREWISYGQTPGKDKFTGACIDEILKQSEAPWG